MRPKTVLDHMGFAVRDYDRSKAFCDRGAAPPPREPVGGSNGGVGAPLIARS